MKLIVRILITSALVLLIANLMTGVHVAGFTTALIVAVVLGLLNVFIGLSFGFKTLQFIAVL
jgi:putative membrane protein